MVYLDNAATTFPKPEEVYLAMDKTNRELCVNAGRGSYKLAQKASKVISNTKNQLRELVHADSSASVVFSPSITIALNQIIQGLEFQPGEVVYATPYEHNAVARTLHLIEKRRNIKIKLLPVKEESLEIDIEKTKYEFSKEKPRAVFCTGMSNVTGYVLPVADIFAEAKKYDAITVLDSAQSLGLISTDSKTLYADIIAFAGHKSLYGPFGVGGFINISNIKLSEVIVGGTGSDSLNLDMPVGPEATYESSSTNIISVAGLNASLNEIDVEKNFEEEKALTEYLVDQLSSVPGIKLFLPSDRNNHIGIVSFTLDGYLSDDVGMILDEDFDISVRTGYHCAPWIHELLDDKKTNGTVRVGLGRFNKKNDIDLLIEALQEL